MADFLQKAKAFATQNTGFCFNLKKGILLAGKKNTRFILMRIFEMYLSLGHLGIFMLFVLHISGNKM